MEIIIGIAFGAIVVVHLYACYNKKKALRMITKPMLLALLAVYYVLCAKNFHPTVLIALILGLVGDAFLLVPESPKFFVAGAAAFAVGHLFYIYTLLFRTVSATLPFNPLYLLLIIPLGIGVFVVFKQLIAHLKGKLKFLMPLYMSVIGMMSVSNIVYFFSSIKVGAPIAWPAVMVIGSFFFIASDTILAFSLFKGGVKRANFYIMLTYIFAQTMLTMGFANM